MSTLVLILVGWVMMSQVTDGILESRRDSAQKEAVAQLASLTGSINAADPAQIAAEAVSTGRRAPTALACTRWC